MITLGLRLGLIFGCWLFASAIQAQPVRFVTQNFPPFSYIEQGEVAGPARDLIDQVCRQMALDCQHRLLPWERAQKLLQVGHAEGIYLLGWNPERAARIHFSVPLFTTEYGLFTHQEDPLYQLDIPSLTGYRIGVMDASNTLRSLQVLQQLGHRFEIVPLNDSQTAFRMLNVGRLDAVYSNHDVGRALIRRLQLSELHYAVPHRQLSYYVGFNRDRVDEEWLELFNTQVESLQQNGWLERLMRRYDLH